MLSSSRILDRLKATFDHDGLVANAGLIVPVTLMARLDLEALIDERVATGSSRPGRKILTVVAAILAGATHIDHVDMLRAGATQKVLPFKAMAASTIGTFLRTFTFGHVRQLDAVLSRSLQRASAIGVGPATKPVVIDLDSTICEVHGKQKQGTGYGYTGVLGYHPLLATLAGTGEMLFARMRHGSANTARGAVRFVDELVAVVRRAGATGPITMRADSGFWAWKLIDRLNVHKISWSITVRLHKHMKQAIAAIDDDAWTDIDYTIGGQAQVAETIYTTGQGKHAAASGWSCAAPVSPTKHNDGCGPTGDTTRSSRTAPTSTRSRPTSSTVNTPPLNSPSATSKKVPDSNTSPRATTTPTPRGSPARCSLITSGSGPPRSPVCPASRTGPGEPASSTCPRSS